MSGDPARRQFRGGPQHGQRGFTPPQSLDGPPLQGYRDQRDFDASSGASGASMNYDGPPRGGHPQHGHPQYSDRRIRQQPPGSGGSSVHSGMHPGSRQGNHLRSPSDMSDRSGSEMSSQTPHMRHNYSGGGGAGYGDDPRYGGGPGPPPQRHDRYGNPIPPQGYAGDARPVQQRYNDDPSRRPPSSRKDSGNGYASSGHTESETASDAGGSRRSSRRSDRSRSSRHGSDRDRDERDRRRRDRGGGERSADQGSSADHSGDGSDSQARWQLDGPAPYDSRGRCQRHPHIQLRKKKMLGGWRVLLVNCPDCCVEEMLRMKDERGRRKKDGGRRSSASQDGSRDGGARSGRRNNAATSSRDGSSAASASMPPISQINIKKSGSGRGGAGRGGPGGGPGGGLDPDSDVESMASTASEITYGTRTESHSHGGNSAGPSLDSGSGPHRVTRMPFTDAYGDRGWYTGEVASGSGLPHGQGTMHYCDGRVRGGWWSNGLAGGPPRGTRGDDDGGLGGVPLPGPSASGRHGGRGGGNVPPQSQRLALPPPVQQQRGAPRGDASAGSRGSHPASTHRDYGGVPPGPAAGYDRGGGGGGYGDQYGGAGYGGGGHNHARPQHSHDGPDHLPGKAVFDMDWTDLRGHDGRYTGETDGSGEPHGMGSMRYLDGAVEEGEWYHGELERRVAGLSVRMR